MKFLFFVVMLLSQSQVYAQTGGKAGSGGGGAWECYKREESLWYNLLVDLWEAEKIGIPDGNGNRLKLVIDYNDLSIDEQISRAAIKVKDIDNGFYHKLLKAVEYVKTHWDDIEDPEVEIAPPSDIKNGFKPRGCNLAGMLYFDGVTGKVKRKKEIYDRLKNDTHKAASIMHEAVYKVLRESAPNRHTESTKARQLTACLFSKTPCLREYDPISLPQDRKVLSCHSTYTDFYLYNEDRDFVIDEPGAFINSINHITDWFFVYKRIGGSVFAGPKPFSRGRVTFGDRIETSPLWTPLRDFDYVVGPMYFLVLDENKKPQLSVYNHDFKDDSDPGDYVNVVTCK